MEDIEKKIKAVVSFSGGKDSMLCIYRALKENYDIIGLLVTVDTDKNSCFHKINYDILKEISTKIDIPLICIECGGNSNYEEQFEKTLKKVSKMGAEVCIFGDIDIEHHKAWGEDRCLQAGMKSYFPLWQEKREHIVNEIIEKGFKAIIKKVNLEKLDESFLGKEINEETIQEISKCGSDICGENGEYHTIVIDGPIFKNKVNLKQIGIEKNKNEAYLEIKLK